MSEGLSGRVPLLWSVHRVPARRCRTMRSTVSISSLERDWLPSCPDFDEEEAGAGEGRVVVPALARERVDGAEAPLVVELGSGGQIAGWSTCTKAATSAPSGRAPLVGCSS